MRLPLSTLLKESKLFMKKNTIRKSPNDSKELSSNSSKKSEYYKPKINNLRLKFKFIVTLKELHRQLSLMGQANANNKFRKIPKIFKNYSKKFVFSKIATKWNWHKVRTNKKDWTKKYSNYKTYCTKVKSNGNPNPNKIKAKFNKETKIYRNKSKSLENLSLITWKKETKINKNYKKSRFYFNKRIIKWRKLNKEKRPLCKKKLVCNKNSTNT